jgi:hypothetical protein
MVCALAFSAIAASGAAGSKGTTAFTCAEGTEGSFTDSHCRTSGKGNYKHVTIPQNTKTEVKITNENINGVKVPMIFKTSIAGVAIEAKAGGISGKATLENKVNAAGEHYVTGTDMFTVTEVSVPKPACGLFASGSGGTGGGGGKGAEGNVILHLLKATTEGQGDAIKFAPASGETVADFILEGCGSAGTYAITGSVKCIPNGAVCNFNHAETTAAGTLKLGGQKVGMEGSLTFSARANAEQPYTPISPTTVETK